MSQPARTTLVFSIGVLVVSISTVQICVAADKKKPASETPLSSTAKMSSPLFESDILPILKTNCFRCHGSKSKKAELDLRSSVSIFKGGETGPAVVPGALKKSMLFEMIEDGSMPPEGNKPLSNKDIAMIRRWIESGARFRKKSGGDAVAETEMTQHDVHPILLRRCIMCHGLQNREGKLDLRSKTAMLKGGKSGPALVPGKPEKSLLIQKIRDSLMPPKTSHGQAGIEPVTESELKMLTRWIALGASEVVIRPDIATSEPDPLVTDEDRQFWSFRPPKRSRVPAVTQPELVRNPIDAFLLRKLEKQYLSYSAEADRLTLLRRASFDLTGLPPSPEQIQRFLSDTNDDAYEKLVDRLLDSPHYGERWGRFWLDLAGYADSEGKRHADMIRPYAWKYRDYVIRSFNTDKRFDQFLMEQIAGDELVDYEHAKVMTPEIIEKLVATGFLRMAPDGTSANPVNRVEDRLEVIADEIDIFSRGILGLTIKCARCHSHKYDPIPQRDYYRLAAVFKGAYDEYDWMTPQPFGNQWKKSNRRFLEYSTPEERKKHQQHNGEIQKQIKALKSKKDKQSKNKIKTLQATLLPEPKIRALWDRGRPSLTYIYRRGDHLNASRLVGPGVPSVLTDGKNPFEVTPPRENATQTGRRLALARWVVQPNHPLTARVQVNRIWKQHFGTGIVESLDNFGQTGTAPSHPELLDWLAVEFVRNGWSIKTMHRLIMNSTAYRQVSTLSTKLAKLDPDNRLLSRMPLHRMDAEQMHDSLLLVSGMLDERQFGRPDPVDVRGDGLVTARRSDQGWRRSIYVRQRRKEMPTILETFDLPQMNPNCTERASSTVVSQPLHLLNNKKIYDLAGFFAERVLKQAGVDRNRQIDRAYLIALNRSPSAAEKQIASETLEQLSRQWAAEFAKRSEPSSSSDSPDQRALADLCHMLINSAAFYYID